MSISALLGLVIALLVVVASARTIRRIGLRRFSLAVGRLGWDVGKVALSGASLVAGALAASAPRKTGEDPFDHGYDPFDANDPANSARPESPFYAGDRKPGGI
jgi:hypothetical protein